MNKNFPFQKIGLFILIFGLFISPSLFGADKRVILFPLAVYGDSSKAYLGQGLKSMLSSRLSGKGITLMGDESYGARLDEEEKQGIISEKRAEELAGDLEADYAVFGSLTTVGSSYSLDLAVLDLSGEEHRILRVSEVTEEDQLIPRLADIASRLKAIFQGIDPVSEKGPESPAAPVEPAKPAEPIEPAETPEKTSKVERDLTSLSPTGELAIPMMVMAFDTADLNNDGALEWIVVGQQDLFIYSSEKGTYVRKGGLEASQGEMFLKVSAGDADQNGKPEIYLVSLYGRRVRTVVWEWSGTFKRLFHITGNVRVLREPGQTKPRLLFQDTRTDEPFYGKIYWMDYEKKDKLTQKEPLTHLNDVQFYTLTFLDLDKDGRMECLGLDDDSYLHIWDSEGVSIWESEEKMGGTNHNIRLNVNQLHLPITNIALNSRLAILDLDRDGNEEIVAVKNVAEFELFEGLRLYTKGHVTAYKIEKTQLVPIWTSRNIDQCITDIQTDGRTLFLATHKAQRSYISKGSGKIMWFE
jgi:hypothetical protein